MKLYKDMAMTRDGLLIIITRMIIVKAKYSTRFKFGNYDMKDSKQKFQYINFDLAIDFVWLDGLFIFLYSIDIFKSSNKSLNYIHMSLK